MLCGHLVFVAHNKWLNIHNLNPKGSAANLMLAYFLNVWLKTAIDVLST